jgi:hypothetical protein
MASLQNYITSCQSRFNRRDYEQFILPIIKLFQQEINLTNKKVLNKITINQYVENVKVRINIDKETLKDQSEIIEVDKLLKILEEEKNTLI